MSDYFEAKDMLGDLGQSVAMLHNSTRFPTHRLLATIDTFFFSEKSKVLVSIQNVAVRKM